MKSVIVTGGNSGIGSYIVRKLSSEGFHVFAAARTKKGLKEIQEFPSQENITPILVDVTVQKTIDEAVKTVKDSGHSLAGLVNNAGTAQMSPLLYTSIEEIHRTFNVNVYGIHRMVTAFIESLMESKGRIVNIGSVSGIITGFANASYSMSKHALEAYTDGLSVELQKFGIKVTLVEPGNFDSKLVRNIPKMIKEKSRTVKSTYYKEEFEEFIENIEEDFSSEDSSERPEPAPVADAVFDALTSDCPKVRSMVSEQEYLAQMTIKRGILEVLQLNQNHKYSYSDSELMELVEKMLKLNPTDAQFQSLYHL